MKYYIRSWKFKALMFLLKILFFFAAAPSHQKPGNKLRLGVSLLKPVFPHFSVPSPWPAQRPLSLTSATASEPSLRSCGSKICQITSKCRRKWWKPEESRHRRWEERTSATHSGRLALTRFWRRSRSEKNVMLTKRQQSTTTKGPVRQVLQPRSLELSWTAQPGPEIDPTPGVESSRRNSLFPVSPERETSGHVRRPKPPTVGVLF